MAQKLTKYYLGLLLALSVFSAYAQTPISLREYLRKIENGYEVSFSFLDRDIERVTLVPPAEASDLDTILSFLSQKTGLKFTSIDAQTIVISSKKVTGTVCAYVFDVDYETPIPGVLAQISSVSAVTDASGLFTLAFQEEEDTIKLSHVSYGTADIVLNQKNSDCDTIFLSMNANFLAPLSFEYVITPGIQYSGTATVELDNENLSILPGMTEPDVFHSLQALPGVMSLDESAANLNIRGGTNDQNLFLWNDVRLYQTGHFFGLFSAINPFSVNKTSLIMSGSQSGLDRAVSSTVAITTSPEEKEEPYLEVGVNGINADVVFNTKWTDKWQISGGLRASYNMLLPTPTYVRYDQRAFSNSEIAKASYDSILEDSKDFYYVDVETSAVYRPKDGEKIEFHGLLINNDLRVGQLGVIDTASARQNSSLLQNSYLLAATYQKQLNDGQLSIGSFNSFYQLQAKDENNFTGLSLRQSNNIQDYGLRFEYERSLAESLDLTFGYFWNEVGIENIDELINPDFRQARKNVLRTHSIYTSASGKWLKGRLNLDAGIRVNYLGKYEKVLFLPRLAFRYFLDQNFSANITYESKSQSMSQIINFQTDFLGIEKRRWVFTEERGAENLLSHQLSAGLQYDAGKVLVNLDAYAKSVNGILATSQEFVNQFEFNRSIGSYTSQGLDLLLTWRNSRLDIWSSYSFAYTNYNFQSFVPQQFSSNFDIRNYLTVGASYKQKGFKLSAGAKYRTGRQHTEALSYDPTVDTIRFAMPNSSILPAYFRLDLSSSYEFILHKKSILQLGISFWNLTNRRNVLQRYYVKTDENDFLAVDQNGLRFLPNFNLRYIF